MYFSKKQLKSTGYYIILLLQYCNISHKFTSDKREKE